MYYCNTNAHTVHFHDAEQLNVQPLRGMFDSETGNINPSGVFIVYVPDDDPVLSRKYRTYEQMGMLAKFFPERVGNLKRLSPGSDLKIPVLDVKTKEEFFISPDEDVDEVKPPEPMKKVAKKKAKPKAAKPKEEPGEESLEEEETDEPEDDEGNDEPEEESLEEEESKPKPKKKKSSAKKKSSGAKRKSTKKKSGGQKKKSSE